MPQEKKTEREREKYLQSKKYELFKKKEAARVGEYHLKKRFQSNYWSALQRQPQAQYQERLQHFQQNSFRAKMFTRLKDHSHQSAEEGQGDWKSFLKIQCTYSCTYRIRKKKE